MTILRLICLVFVTCIGLAGPSYAAPIQVTDALGRQVTLPGPAQHIVLAQARHFPVIALLHPDPASILAGWSDEFKTSFQNEYRSYLEHYPRLADVPVVGRHRPDSFSVETVLALRPDLVVLTLSFTGLKAGQSPDDSPLIQRFEAAGVPVIVIDFFLEPMLNTVPSLEALGAALGRTDQTRDFIDFYSSHVQRVKNGLAGLADDDRPPVFIHAHAGSTDCCNSPGTGTFNDMVVYAGGHNIAGDVLKTPTGRLNFEYINARNPVVYVATGTGSGKRANNGLHIGEGATVEDARASLARIIHDNKLDSLAAVRSGNSHGIWHAFNDSPLHVVFIEALAHWIHPDRFPDVSPTETLNTISREFLPVPMQGTYLVDLRPSDSP
ncbi:MAG: ABC transporter substrate-binding protein [Alcaligenaceae bacterium]|nr:ABC transporter substrate-binding protein [Alcaligenaceae bacterium]